MITMPISMCTKAITLLEPMTQNEEAMSIKDELFKVQTSASFSKNTYVVNIAENTAKRLLDILEKANLDLDEVLPNDFILTHEADINLNGLE